MPDSMAPPAACPPTTHLAHHYLHPHPYPLQDIRPRWDSIIKTLDYNIGLSRFAGPDKGFNDLDMLYGGWVGGVESNQALLSGGTTAAVVPAPQHSHFVPCPLPCLALPAVGNDTGLSHTEQRVHFALWALLKSPLMIGHDLRDFSDSSLGILKAKVGANTPAAVAAGCRGVWCCILQRRTGVRLLQVGSVHLCRRVPARSPPRNFCPGPK